MSLGLEKRHQQLLAQAIAAELPRVTVRNKSFIDASGALLLAEEALPHGPKAKDKKLITDLERYISETPVYDFVYQTLTRELDDKYDPKSPSLSLIQLDGYADPKAVADRLVRDFESLPWEYSLHVRLENDFSKLFARNTKAAPISDAVTLVTPDENFLKMFPPPVEPTDPSLTWALPPWAQSHPQSWDLTSMYLRVNAHGFIGEYGETAPLKEAISELKAFCGIAIGLSSPLNKGYFLEAFQFATAARIGRVS
jgi:hypothetical protein